MPVYVLCHQRFFDRDIVLIVLESRLFVYSINNLANTANNPDVYKPFLREVQRRVNLLQIHAEPQEHNTHVLAH